MGKFAACAVAAIAVAFATVPASAEYHAGQPMKVNGKCWVGAPGYTSGTFGHWGQCAAPAGFLRHPLRARRDRHDDR
jgi:hypothetical protein